MQSIRPPQPIRYVMSVEKLCGAREILIGHCRQYVVGKVGIQQAYPPPRVVNIQFAPTYFPKERGPKLQDGEL
jgi:hypothetical protein